MHTAIADDIISKKRASNTGNREEMEDGGKGRRKTGLRPQETPLGSGTAFGALLAKNRKPLCGRR